MENHQPFPNPIPADHPASDQLATEQSTLEVVQASIPCADEVVASLQPPPLPAISSLERTPTSEAQDELDVRLAAARVSRAQTFSKVSNLFNKIFAE